MPTAQPPSTVHAVRQLIASQPKGAQVRVVETHSPLPSHFFSVAFASAGAELGTPTPSSVEVSATLDPYCVLTVLGP